MVGVVIPLYLTKFIDNIIENLKETTKDVDAVFCFVNDGKSEIVEHFNKINLPENMHVFHRDTNGGFATANNSGWKHLLNLYPDIDYLGTLNDDTIPHKDWLKEMIKSISVDENIAAVVPNIREFENGVECDSYAVFKYYNDPGNPMQVVEKKVYEDMFTKAMSGCCFIARADILKEVEFFDGRFRNGCEDVDLSLKLLTEGYKIIACAKATITHLAGSSRLTKPTISDDIQFSTDLLSLKWGTNYELYNDEMN